MPPDGATLASVHPDADSVSAMAVLASRSAGMPVDAALVFAVGRFDRLGPSAGAVPPLVSAIARVAADHKRALADRVAWVQKALAGESDPAEVAGLVAQRDAELAAARAASSVIKRAGGRVVVVTGNSRYGTVLGYEWADTVVCYAPEFPREPKDLSQGVFRKYTICRRDSHVPTDLPAALAELQALEVAAGGDPSNNWGGRGDICGSPQSVSSALTLEQVLAVVERHLK